MTKRRGTVWIDADLCKGCGLCIAACPTGSLRPGEGRNRAGYTPAAFLPDTGCTACGVCFYACPEPAAVTVFAKPREAA